MLRLAPAIVGMLVCLTVVLGFAQTIWRARRDGVLTGGDLPKGARIERAADSARFDRMLSDYERFAALPISFAVAGILVGALALWVALASDAG